MPPMVIGCHLSIRNGYYNTAQQTKELGADCFQYFTKNPRILSIKRWSSYDTHQCAQFCQREGIISLAHAPYLTNLAEHSPNRQHDIIQSAINDLHIAEACGSIGVVIHFGTSKQDDKLAGYRTIIDTLNIIDRK